MTSFFLFPKFGGITPVRSGCSMVCFLTHPPHGLPFPVSFDFTFARLRAWGVQPQDDCLQLPVNWASLTDLTIGGNLWTSAILSLHQAVDLLSRCPRFIIRCKLEIRNAEVTPTQFAVLTLPTSNPSQYLRQPCSIAWIFLSYTKSNTIAIPTPHLTLPRDPGYLRFSEN